MMSYLGSLFRPVAPERSWLDLDALAPPALRAEADELSAELRAAHDALAKTAVRVVALFVANDLALQSAADELRSILNDSDIDDIQDDLSHLVSMATGRERVLEVLYEVADVANPEDLLDRATQLARVPRIGPQNPQE